MTVEKILVIEQDSSLAAFIKEAVREKTEKVFTCSQADTAATFLKEHTFSLVFCELSDPLGFNMLELILARNPRALVVLLAFPYQIEQAAKGVRLGAFHYLIKPFSLEAIKAVIKKAEEYRFVSQKGASLQKERSDTQKKREQIIAESPFMRKILDDVVKIAQSDASVFISGESGTGKEVIAHAIHFQSRRTQGPFVKVNCAAIPESLIESEFFGHEKGAFTGAIQQRLGRFEIANQGTLLLDEISEVPLTVQSKLLRAVQEQEFERVGGVKAVSVNVRLISTSNRNMKEAIEQKVFREDLYYRLNVVPIYLPPLRERKEDILPLSTYFLERLCLENNKAPKQISTEAQKKLLDYPWPGNIRELANIIERTVVMNASDLIQPEELAIECLNSAFSSNTLFCPSPFIFKEMTLQEQEKRLILETLSHYKHNKTKTAEALGISIRTLRNKLYKYRNFSSAVSIK